MGFIFLQLEIKNLLFKRLLLKINTAHITVYGNVRQGNNQCEALYVIILWKEIYLQLIF